MKKWPYVVIILLLGVVIWQFSDRKDQESVVEIPNEEINGSDDGAPETEDIFDGEEKTSFTESTEFVDIEASYPVFSNTKLSAAVENFVEAEIRQFKKDISFDNFPKEEYDRIKEFGYKYSFEGGYEIHKGKGISSILFDFSTYTGGAHGGHYLKSLNYDENGTKLGIGSLFVPSSDYLSRLSTLSREKLKAALDENLGQWADDGTSAVSDNFNTFYVTEEGMLHIIFQPYQVAPWAAGVPEIDIGLVAELGDILNPDLFNAD